MTERSLGALKLSLDPRALSRAGQAFDDSWAAIAASFSEAEVEDARTRLATIILGLAADGSRDVEEVKTAALGFFSAARSKADVLH
jgi:hypothetical protein